MGTQRCSLPSPVRTSTRPVVLHGAARLPGGVRGVGMRKIQVIVGDQIMQELVGFFSLNEVDHAG